MKKLLMIVFACQFITIANAQTTRQIWLTHLDKVARPVMETMAADQLKEKMQVEVLARGRDSSFRASVTYLEAFGRTLSGIAPWLNLEGGTKAEVDMRNQYRTWALKCIANAVNPKAKDYLRWDGGQPLVDASFMAFGLVRCPWLWDHLDATVKQQVVDAFKITRPTVPSFSNWILFSGMIEAFFAKYGYEYDPVRIQFAVREFANQWYVGDGFFSDGMHFHMDYYNSIVIHPYLAAIVEVMNNKGRDYQWFTANMDKINKRYAEIQERNINTDGSYPIIGRSLAYRGGVFHHLADMALRKKLPESLMPAQVREALTAVIKKTLDAPGTFNSNGWLYIGVHGHQPGLGESYITTGSVYLCTNIFLPLGLPETDEFWSAPPAPWTAVKVWNGEDVHTDHAMDLQ